MAKFKSIIFHQPPHSQALLAVKNKSIRTKFVLTKATATSLSLIDSTGGKTDV